MTQGQWPFDLDCDLYAKKFKSFFQTLLLPRAKYFTNTSGLFKNWMLILVLLCENERQRWDALRYIKASSEAQRFYVYRDASHLWRSFSH